MNRLFGILFIITLTLMAGCGSVAGGSTDAQPGSPTQQSSEATRGLPTEIASPTSESIEIPTDYPTSNPTPRPTARPPTAGEAGQSWLSPVDEMELLFIPAGGFRMGTLRDYAGGQPDEWPQRIVELPAFWIDSTEVTWGMYQLCEQAGICSRISPSRPEWAQDNHPVIMVQWQDAADYCQWAGRRLPTEAEWEKASRGTEGRRYPWEWIGAPQSGGDLRLNFCDANCPYEFGSAEFDDGFAYTAPVGSFPAGASPYGVLDTAGNVWEWTADWYQADRYREEGADLSVGPEAGTMRVIRGGSWLEPALQGVVMTSRSANRSWQPPDQARPDLGFRCALAAQGEESGG